MSKHYTKMTLGGLIAALRELGPEAKVCGFDQDIDSYRGSYERNAVKASDVPMAASDMADALESQVGKPIFGYKGGDYTVSIEQGVYLAEYGSMGAVFAGLEQVEPGLYEPVVVDDGMVW